MTHLRKNGFVAAAAVSVLLSAVLAFAAAADLQPEGVAADLVARNNAMVSGLKQLHDSGDLTQPAALELIREHASPKLDFAKLTQRAMGKHWRKADDDARQKLQAAFRELLENTYAKLLSGYGGQEVRLADAKARANGGASVILEVRGGRSAMIEYVCDETEGGDYSVGDIKVEGVSLIANYRRQFGSVIKKSGIEGLVIELQERATSRAPAE